MIWALDIWLRYIGSMAILKASKSQNYFKLKLHLTQLNYWYLYLVGEVFVHVEISQYKYKNEKGAPCLCVDFFLWLKLASKIAKVYIPTQQQKKLNKSRTGIEIWLVA